MLKFTAFLLSALILMPGLLFTACGKGGADTGSPDISAPATQGPRPTQMPVFENRYVLPEELKEQYELFSFVFPPDEEIAEFGCSTEPFEMSLILPKGWECRLKRAETLPLPAVCGNSAVPDYYVEFCNRCGIVTGALDFHKYDLKNEDSADDPANIYADLINAENFFLIEDRSEPQYMQAVYKPVSHEGDNVTAITEAVETQDENSSGNKMESFPAIVSYDSFRKVYAAIEFFVSDGSDPGFLLTPAQIELIAGSIRIY